MVMTLLVAFVILVSDPAKALLLLPIFFSSATLRKAWQLFGDLKQELEVLWARLQENKLVRLREKFPM
jgi:hypothetical protein